MSNEWLERWANGRTGWHQAEGNAGLRKHWPETSGRVLVPLCGKSPDMLWLAARGHDVVGVELAEAAIREFFAEQTLDFNFDDTGPMHCYSAVDLPITLYCGDYFSFAGDRFDGLYDRGALVAINPSLREKYIRVTRNLLNPDARRLIVTLEYEQDVVQGPPFAVTANEMTRYWPDLERVSAQEDIENCPPKFREGGLTTIKEVVWLSAG
jgi:thiopurine S-methyltransferase